MKKILLALTVLLVSSSMVFAQEHEVTGTVTDPDGVGIPGISVHIKGTNTGIATDADGHYSLSVKEDGTLVFSGIGYDEKEISVSGKSVVNTTMESGTQNLDELVVVGYGTTTKKDFTGTVKSVSAERIENKDVSDVSQALAGEAPGVRVITNSGQPGSAPTVRIRGFGSVNGNRSPLYVVDGVPIDNTNSDVSGEGINPLNSINPDDVKSINVLSDAVATAIYGSRGANGVVVITTKSGEGKKPFVEVNFKYGTNKQIIPRHQVITSPEEYLGLAWESLYNNINYGDLAVAGGVHDDATSSNLTNNNIFGQVGLSPNYDIWKGDPADLVDPKTRKVKPGVERKYTPGRWSDYAFQPSSRIETNVRMGGSSEKTSYYTSLGYLDDKGYSLKSRFKRITARVNLKHDVTDWLSSKMNFSYAHSKTNNVGQESNSSSLFWFVDNIPPIYGVFLRDKNGKKVPDPIFGGYRYDYGNNGRGFGLGTNSVGDATYNTKESRRNDFNGNGAINVKFLKHFTFKSQIGLQYFNNDYMNLVNKFYGSAASSNGSIQHDKVERFSYDWLNIVHYNQSFGNHNVNALIAHEASSWKSHILSAFKSNLVQNDNTELDNGVISSPTSSYTIGYELESIFGQVNYDYKGTYYFSGSLRRDGSSRFRKDKWGTFGSLGLGWMISNENFMNSANIIDHLKLKASYGVIGDQAGVGYYPGYDLWDISNVNDGPAFSFETKGNPDLTWETSKVFQVGAEFGLGDFLDGSVDYYIKNTENLIFNRRRGPSIGYAVVQVNGGILRNQGVEFDLTGHLIHQKDFHIDLGINGEVLQNKLTEMPIDPFTKKPKLLDIESYYGWGKGHSIYDYYMRQYAGVDPDDGLSQWTVYYVDNNENGAYDKGEGIGSLTNYKADPDNKGKDIEKATTKTYADATQFYVGKSSIPDVRGAVNLTADYKGFNLAVQFLYGIGGYGYDFVYARLMDNPNIGVNNWSTDIKKRWQKPGDVTDVPRLSNGFDPSVSSSSTRFLTKASYLALNNIRLGYNFPKELFSNVGITDLSIWVSGDNLWLLSARKGFNPSITQNGVTDWYTYNPLSTLSAGIKIRF